MFKRRQNTKVKADDTIKKGDTMDTLYEDVLAMIEEKVDEIALFFQDRLGITAGDQPPELAIPMYDAEERLADIITTTLEFQKGD